MRRARRVRGEHAALLAEIGSWGERWQEYRYKSHIAALSKALLGAATEILKRVPLLASTEGEPLPDTDRVEAVLVWIRALYEYYESRIAQRRDESTRLLLDAADEIVWSCYRPAVRQRRPAPLVFLEATTSPWALESTRPLPAHLAPKADAAPLAMILDGMPVPLIAVPRWLERSASTLVVLAHEAGHHVYADLALKAHFEALVDCAAGRHEPARSPLWVAWSAEIFADVWCVAGMGLWAVYALEEEAWLGPGVRERVHKSYPPLALRLHLMVAVAKQFGYRRPEAAKFPVEALATYPVVDATIAEELATLLGSATAPATPQVHRTPVHLALAAILPAADRLSDFEETVLAYAGQLVRGHAPAAAERDDEARRLACAAVQANLQGAAHSTVMRALQKPFAQIVLRSPTRAGEAVPIGLFDAIVSLVDQEIDVSLADPETRA